MGGGTGSGLGSLILSKVAEEYSNKLAFNFSIFPESANKNSSTSDVVVEPYNAIFSIQALIESSSADFVLENAALYRICTQTLKEAHPTFADINYIVAQAMSNTTSSLRFPGI